GVQQRREHAAGALRGLRPAPGPHRPPGRTAAALTSLAPARGEGRSEKGDGRVDRPSPFPGAASRRDGALEARNTRTPVVSGGAGPCESRQAVDGATPGLVRFSYLRA